ncbi:MAG TPA: DUF2599 domain-containing protein [Polyangiaceae bacterium]
MAVEEHPAPRPWRRTAALLALAALAVGCAPAGVGSGPRSTPTVEPSPTPPVAATTTTPPPAPSIAPSSTLVASVRWVTIDGRPSLEVVPTSALRGTPSRAAGEAAWADVVRAEPTADTAGMEDQFICHVQFASAKPVFHLEPWRPAVGYLRTLVAGCNPGPLPDADLRP